ncbi:MAG TPA: DNA-processing protein DprA [Thermoanaerobaculia bacterium]|nr:DNA-processing protein DprA [Thermoanaerobaculia bacterium]
MDRPVTPLNEYTPAQLLGRAMNDVEQKNAPERLYVSGDVRLARGGVRVSIVGARKASPEGLRRARKLAVELVQEGVVVVSGLALGIDAAAHNGAIDAGGRTIAVLGTPLSKSYPQENQELQSRIMREHLAVTPYAPGAKVYPSNFPYRNRVMALISDATVIVEASDTSGSISQGWEAIRLGRLLFIMKSITETPGLTWPQEMRRYGAQVLADTRPLLRLLPIEGDRELARVAAF